MRASRNIYKDEVDFTALALQSPDFAKQYVQPSATCMFPSVTKILQLEIQWAAGL